MERSLLEKYYLVTGGTSGIGLAVVEQLSRLGGNVIGVGRSREGCLAAEAKMRQWNRQVRYFQADFSLQSEVCKLVEQLRNEIPRLDCLINNAGIFTYHLSLTVEGYETQWAVNHLASFLLTWELLPLLKEAQQSRVITVSSGSHYGSKLRWDDLQLLHRYNCLQAYKQTKLCNVLFTAELNRRLGEQSSVRAFAADPGLVFTEMGFKGNPWLVRWIWGWRRRGGISPEKSAKGIVFLANEPSIQDSKEIYWKHGEPRPPNPYALDEDAAKMLWEISAEMVGLSGDLGA